MIGLGSDKNKIEKQKREMRLFNELKLMLVTFYSLQTLGLDH